MSGLVLSKGAAGGLSMTLSVLWVVLEVTSGATLHSRHHANQGVAQCSPMALATDCGYYNCLDQTLGCDGRKTFSHAFGRKFCERVQTGNHHFTEEGIQWAERVNTCVLKTLAIQISDRNTCSSRDLSISAFYSCTANEDICRRLVTEREAVFSLFTYRRFMTLIQAASHCDRHTVNTFLRWGMRHMHMSH